MSDNATTPVPTVSVVMPVLNPNPVYFPLAVRSVLEQTFTDWELVIVEDPSERSAKELLAPLHDPRIRHIANAERTGLIAQRNRGLAEARGELVALLDADDIAEPDRLAKQVAYLNDRAGVTVLGSQLTIIDAAGEPLAARSYPLDHESIVRAMHRFNPVANPATMFRKSAIVEAGGYQKFPGSEDYELWCRLARRGCRFANYPEALLRYRIHGGAIKATKLRSLLRDSLEIKRLYWQGDLDLGARARMLAERVLLWMPPPLVLRLFLSIEYSHNPRPAGGAGTPPADARGSPAQDAPSQQGHPDRNVLSLQQSAPPNSLSPMPPPINAASNLWIVMAAYNEGSRLKDTLQGLCGRYPNVVVVDDGSRDDTGDWAMRFPVWLLRHVVNCGQGAALQTGIDFALRQGAEVIVTFDADGQHSANEIDSLVEPIRSEKFDVALGSRFLGQTIGMVWTRWLVLKLGVLFTRVFSRIRVTDAHNGFRAMNRHAAQTIRITQDRMAHASEILDRIREHGLRFCEVPVTIRYTEATMQKGQSSWNAIRIVWQLVLGRMVR